MDMQLLFMLVLAWVGMIVHFLKKKMKDGSESFMAIKRYFQDHVKSTIVTFLSVTTTVIVLFYGANTQLTLLTAVGIGYMGDSVLNKWDHYKLK